MPRPENGRMCVYLFLLPLIEDVNLLFPLSPDILLVTTTAFVSSPSVNWCLSDTYY